MSSDDIPDRVLAFLAEPIETVPQLEKIRTPMTAVLGFTELAADRVPPGVLRADERARRGKLARSRRLELTDERPWTQRADT